MPMYLLRPSQRQTHRVLAAPPGHEGPRPRRGLAFVVALLIVGGAVGAGAALMLHDRFGHGAERSL